jgi:hypothetical protein
MAARIEIIIISELAATDPPAHAPKTEEVGEFH